VIGYVLIAQVVVGSVKSDPTKKKGAVFALTVMVLFIIVSIADSHGVGLHHFI
jgi:uncharacterized membrane protein SirB2